MGLFRSAMGLFRGKAGKEAEKGAAGLLKEQVSTVQAQPEVARKEVKEQVSAVQAQPEVARAEVKREARPDPNKPGWGLTIGPDISKARENRASQE